MLPTIAFAQLKMDGNGKMSLGPPFAPTFSPSQFGSGKSDTLSILKIYGNTDKYRGGGQITFGDWDAPNLECGQQMLRHLMMFL